MLCYVQMLVSSQCTQCLRQPLMALALNAGCACKWTPDCVPINADGGFFTGRIDFNRNSWWNWTVILSNFIVILGMANPRSKYCKDHTTAFGGRCDPHVCMKIFQGVGRAAHPNTGRDLSPSHLTVQIVLVFVGPLCAIACINICAH